MPPRPQKRPHHPVRIYFRRFRMTCWLLVLAVIGCVLYLNLIGLPDFAKRSLQDKLRQHGLDLEFSRLRLSFYRGLVADNVRFGRMDRSLTPQLSARQMEVSLNGAALRRFQIQIGGITLREGQAVWPLVETNRPLREVKLEKIQAAIRFLPGDQWELDNFQATLGGAKLFASGSLTNASAIRDWKILQAAPPVPAPAPGPEGKLPPRWRQVLDTLEQIQFATPPGLRLTFYGDGRDIDTFRVALTLAVPEATTPWGQLTDARLIMRALGPSQITASLTADAATRWGQVSNARLQVQTQGDAELEASLAADVASLWGKLSDAHLTLHTTDRSHWTADLNVPAITAPWGLLTDTHVAVQTLGPLDFGAAAVLPWPVPPLSWKGEVRNFSTPKIEVQDISVAGAWQSPQLTLSQIHAQLGGKYDGRLDWNAATGVVHFDGASDFDPQQIKPLLDEKAAHWLGQFSWEQPPQIRMAGSAQLPTDWKWTPEARDRVLASLQLNGSFAVGPAAFQNIPALSAHSPLVYSNAVWTLPDLHIVRPEGELQISLRTDERSQDYHWQIRGPFDPNCVRPLLDAKQQHGLDLAQFTTAPVLDVELWGRWRDYDRIGARGNVAISNFTFRGEAVTSLRTRLDYTNEFLQLLAPEVTRGTNEAGHADGAAVDFAHDMIYLTNAVATLDAVAVAHCIGPITTQHLEPYHFDNPPFARVNGSVCFATNHISDLHFYLSGGPFHWWKFNLPHIDGELVWVNDTLLLTNIVADFYHGSLTGMADFDFSPPIGNDFHFDLSCTNAELGALMQDLSGDGNDLKGKLNGRLTVTRANTDDWKSWQGGGQMFLHDGELWGIPVFGVFAPILDTMWSNLGSGRASEGTATFTITNSVVRSDNLQLRSPAMRMQYRGTVDFDGNLNARVEAELLRDTWMFGPVVSTVLWPVTKAFEYQVTGTLGNPQTEPLYIPKPLMIPLHPIQSLKELILEKPADTNAPPKFMTLPPAGDPGP